MANKSICYIYANPKGDYVLGQALISKPTDFVWGDREDGTDNPEDEVHFKTVTLDIADQEIIDMHSHLKKVDDRNTPTALVNI